MEIYRSTTIGKALIDSLNTMIEDGDISSEEAIEVLKNYEDIFLLNYSKDVSKKIIPSITIEVTKKLLSDRGG